MERPAREDWTEDEAMSGDRVKQTTVQWLEEGRAEGLVEGRSRDRQRQIDVMRLMAARKFDEATAEELRGRLQWVVDHDQIGEIGEWLIESEHADEFLDRVKQPSLETIGEVLLEVGDGCKAQWRGDGRAEGLATGREQRRAKQAEILCRMAARKFDQGTAERLAGALAEIADSRRLGVIGMWLIDCEHADAFLDRVEKQTQKEGTNEMIAKLMEMLSECEVQWRAEGQARGRALGRTEIMRRQAARKFDDTTAERLAVQLQRIADPEQMGEVGEWLIECEDARELFDRVEGLTGRWFSSSVAASRTASAPPRL